jgi:hypothetical protein
MSSASCEAEPNSESVIGSSSVAKEIIDQRLSTPAAIRRILASAYEEADYAATVTGVTFSLTLLRPRESRDAASLALFDCHRAERGPARDSAAGFP